MTTQQQRVALVKSESRRIQQYLSGLSAEDLARPSACDAWEVRDVVAHLIGGVDLFAANISRGVQGDSTPPDGFPPAGVSSLMARLEAGAQRAISLRESMGDPILTTFAARCEHLNQLLEGLAVHDWERLCYHPGKVISVATYVDLRLAELVVHEWDIRSKLDASAQLSNQCLPAVMDLMPAFVVGTLFRPGTKQSASGRFRFELTGLVSGSHEIVVENGYSHMEAPGNGPTRATFRCDTETFALLVYGRVSLDKAESEGRLTVQGDREFASLISG
ncbi:MAG: maleylpyruvate isomerase family mycothiol-dependent enzyme [Chloroflexota bacterium]|nr:maleylpyruvate isomerase family mycothiol-dependent enzyme [Chloroflexota bacterium]